MAGHGCGFRSNTFHETSIAAVDKSVVVDNVMTGSIVDCSSVGFGNGETNSIGETLAEGASSDLDTGGIDLFDY